MAPLVKVAFVPSRNFAGEAELPEPWAHIFYDRRIRDVADSVPKISGYWPSEFLIARKILGGSFH
jgi:hypothetical protein